MQTRNDKINFNLPSKYKSETSENLSNHIETALQGQIPAHNMVYGVRSKSRTRFVKM